MIISRTAISPFVIRGGGGSAASLSSTASSVDGLFHVTIVLGASDSGFATSDVNVTNGVCQYVTSQDNVTWTAFIMPDGVGSVLTSVGASNVVTTTLNPAWEYLTQSDTSNLYYDFRELVGLNGDTIETTDPALRDLSGNSRTLTKLNTGVVNMLTAGEPTYRDLTTAAMSIGQTGVAFMNQNFSVNFKWQPTDGQSATVQHICGCKDATNTGLIISIQTNGKLRVNYQGFVWDSTNVVFANGANAASYFDIHFDFTTDTLTVRQDGASVAGSFTTSNISAVNPASYASTQDFYIGSFNNNGGAFSNTDSASLSYFACTKLQTTPFTEVASYLNAKKPTLEYLASLTDATYLKVPHDVWISPDMTTAYVSGKGDTTLTSVDGSFGIVDLTTPASPTVLGGVAGTGTQKDGETVLVISATRVVHFADKIALLYNVSNPASPTLVKSVATATGVVNGAVYKNGYVFGANKDGYIDVFDFSDVDNFTLVGSKDVTATMTGPHDIDFCGDNEHVMIASKVTGAQFGIIKVFTGTTLISLASWSFVSAITSAAAPNLIGANRIKRMVDSMGLELAVIFTLQGGGGGNNVVSYSLAGGYASPALNDTFSLTMSPQRGATGGNNYRDRFVIVGNDQGIRLLDTYNSSAFVQSAGYFNATAFTVGGNNNIHDADWWFDGQNRYLITTAHNEGIAIFKINRI
jgi:hypothetical protein